MSIQTREGSGQQVPFNLAYSKPLIPKNGNPYYNSSQYINSYLNMYGKRSFIAPNNFIGTMHQRPDNMQPCQTYIPSKLNRDPVKEGLPILQTPPIPKIYH